MILSDVNIYISAFREESEHHAACLSWLNALMADRAIYGYSEFVMSSFLRIVTNPRTFGTPAPIKTALDFVEQIRNQPHAHRIQPGPKHWEIFSELCSKNDVRGNLVPDAYLAALAIEAGCEWVTLDRGFSRYPGLRWRHPLDSH